MPSLATIGNIPTGFEQLGEVYWVQKREFLGDFSSQDKTPIAIKDVDFGLIRIFAAGKFAYKITEPILFITKFIGTRGLQNSDEIINWLQDQSIVALNTIIGKLKKHKSMSFLDMLPYIPEIEHMCLSFLSFETEQYGIQVTKFSDLVIKLPEEVLKSIDKRSSMSVLKGNYMQVQTGIQSVEEFGHGSADAGANSDIGSIIGANIGSDMNQTINTIPSNIINTPGILSPQSTCQKCGYLINNFIRF